MEPDRQPNPQLPVHAPIAGCWIVLPGILSMLGHLICVSLVLAKWESLEDLNGGPLNFTRSFDGLPTDAPGLSWFSVFAPTWIAELVVVGMAIWLLPRTVRNLRILHINTIAQSMLCALFQLLFAIRLTTRRGSWLVVFSPWYTSMLVQAFLHCRKYPDSRGRRPGFPIGILHLLALVVSLKLEGSFNYASSSWAGVLWPLWAVAGFFMLTLTMGLCCGLPCLMRRDAQVRCHLLCMFSALLLLLCSVVLPGFLALIRLTLWLDGKQIMPARDILVPYIIAVSIILLLLCVSLAIVSFSSALRVRGGLGGADGGSGEDEDGSMAELLASLPAPTALVRESSTLFRRVSSATMVKYEQRKFDHSSGDRLLSRVHSAGGADDSSSNMSTDDGIELGLEAAAAAAALTPQSIELSMREIELENLRQRTRAALSSIRVECGVDLAKPEPRADAAAGPPSEAAAAVAAAAVADATAAALTCGRSSSVADSSDGVRRDSQLVDGDEDEGGDGLEGHLCWICCQGEREAVLLECGHGGMCFSCALRCARKRPALCPMCRAPIQQIVRVAGPAMLVDGELVVPSCPGSCGVARNDAQHGVTTSSSTEGAGAGGAAAVGSAAPAADASDGTGRRERSSPSPSPSDEVPLIR